MGPDFNGDGKHDWKDDAFFHTVINSDENSETNNHSNTGRSPSTGNKGWISTIIALGYLSLLLPGDIPINGFTMFIGLICAGILVVKFLGWVYR